MDKNTRFITISAKCSDLFWMRCMDKDKKSLGEYDGYVPSGLGIGDEFGDYVTFTLDLETGQIQDWKKINLSKVDITLTPENS